MKRLHQVCFRISSLTLLLALWSCARLSAQPALTNFASISSPAAAGALVWGDADKDDDLDLWIMGSRFETSTYRSTVLRNDRNGVLSASLGELTQLNRGHGAWTDFDRDGDLDALMTGYNSTPSPSTAVYRNDLPTTFTSVVTVNRLPNLGDSAIACADADGDGDQDVLICGTSSSSRQAALYLNVGSGSYSNSLLVLPPVSEGAVAWADFDGDGDQDFVLTGSTNGTAAGAVTLLYRNDGSAGFVQVASLPGVYRSAVAWADYDCDGDPDLLLAGVSANGPITMLFRNDNGVFTLATSFPGVADGALAWGDADQDGYPDLAMSGRLSTGAGALFSGFYWNRAGVFTNSLVLLPAMHFSAMAWGDLDYDGQLDLAISGATNGSLPWSGSFSAVYRNTIVTAGTPPRVPVNLAANVQGSDVLLSWLLPNGAPGGLSYDVRVGTTPSGNQIMSPAANTADGFRRLAQAGQAGWSKKMRLRNLPAGTYYWSAQSVNPAYKGSPFAAEGQFTIVNTQPTLTTIAAQTMTMNGTRGPLGFTVGDAETDPAALTVTAVSSNPTLFPAGSVVLGGSGASRDATFTPATNQSGTATIIFTVSDPTGGATTASTRITVNSLVDANAPFPIGQFSIIEPGDADGDGNLDMLIAGTEFISAGSGHTYVKLFLNAGDGTFTATTPNLPAVFNGAFAAWGDYDNDGDLDLFYNGSVYRNDSGSFTLVANLIPGIQNGQAAWGDYDGDGDLDLAVTGSPNSTDFITRIYRNDGNDVFTLINAPLQGLWFSSVAWADVDGDGDLDLAIAGAAAQNTTISANARLYRNDGGDQFVEALSIFGASSAKLTWGDVNGDGLPDLAVTGINGSGTGSEVNDLQLNLGHWQFSRFALHPGGSAYADTKLLDWDRDGDLDLLGGVNSIVAVFANPGTGEFASSSMATTSLRCSALRWGDFDNDSDFDIFVYNTGTVSLSGTNKLFFNPIVNTQPAPPGA
ncbi:MAG TPA: FG-GAP-like repeat-containing protein, partial [Candidatus Dormibacteraeota bacterium]|nr:FG-GAP-like repeat-containing protein [Candidatus Dormibacteraeota bacterium]